MVIFVSPEGSPSRQGVSETEFMERIRERMAQEVGGYVSRTPGLQIRFVAGVYPCDSRQLWQSKWSF